MIRPSGTSIPTQHFMTCFTLKVQGSRKSLMAIWKMWSFRCSNSYYSSRPGPQAHWNWSAVSSVPATAEADQRLSRAFCTSAELVGLGSARLVI